MPAFSALSSGGLSAAGASQKSRRGKAPVSSKPLKIRRRELTFLLRNLSTLVDNGLPLAKTLATLAEERSLRKYASFLDELRRQVESGATFSSALAAHPATFSPVVVNQVRVGERAGTLAATLDRIAAQLEGADKIRSQAIRKLAYPAVLMVAGALSVSFMLLFVIPVFQQTYDEAGVPLPWITRFLISAAEVAKVYGWIAPVAIVAAVVAFKQLRKNPQTGVRVDGAILQLPLFGEWLRNICVLQFMEVLGNLLESGFTVVEALSVSSGALGNQAVRKSVEGLQLAVTRGERFSRELDKLGELFPPVVSQLIVVGEKTGNLTKTTAHIREHLRREIERQTALLVGVLEPVLTISLAVMIGTILLAIYLPMFDMIGAMNAGPK